MCRLLETICLKNGVPQHLAYHEARMARAGAKVALLPILENNHTTGLVKCRVIYTLEGIETIEFQAYTPLPPRTLQIVEAPHLAYPLKYADRSAIEALASQKGVAEDVLITRNGYLTDTSYCNVAFWNGAEWLTPEIPLLEGTARARLIVAGKLKPAPLHILDLPTQFSLRIFNAMLDFEEGYTATTHVL